MLLGSAGRLAKLLGNNWAHAERPAEATRAQDAPASTHFPQKSKQSALLRRTVGSPTARCEIPRRSGHSFAAVPCGTSRAEFAALSSTTDDWEWYKFWVVLSGTILGALGASSLAS